MASIFVNRASVAKSVSTTLGASRDLDALAAGVLEPGSYMPATEGQYEQFRRYLHDVLCMGLIDCGAYRHSEFKLEKIGIVTNIVKLNRQKPDLYTMHDHSITIAEVSVTYNPESSYKMKIAKYAELVSFLESEGISVKFDVILLDLSDSEWEDSFQQLSPMFVDILKDFIEALVSVHANPRFGSLRRRELGQYNLSRLQYTCEDSTLVEQVRKATGVRMEPEKIRDKLEGRGKDLLTDSEYVEIMASEILRRPPQARPSPEPRPVEPETMLKEFSTIFNKKPNTDKIPKILQLGCPSLFEESKLEFTSFLKMLRLTKHHGGYLDLIKASLESTPPDEETHILRLSMSTQQLELEQSQGPGRKSYLKRKGIIEPRKEPTHIGVKPSHIKEVEQLVSTIDELPRMPDLKEVILPSFKVTGVALGVDLRQTFDKILESKVSGVLMFYQLLSNEIVLNSMRRRKTGEYVLGQSGMKGIFFLVAPGPQLRTESSVEFVKIISFVQPVGTGLAATWHLIGDHWESSWLSVDVDRLKHWQRSFDRVSTTLVANAERLVQPGQTFLQSLREEIASGNYTLLALTFLEGKYLTSVTNQTLRYLWMKSLGDKDFKGLAAKFPSRVNSVLQSFMLQRAITSCVEICRTPLEKLVKIERLHRDDETGMYDEATTGVVNRLPRLFTFGGPVPISYNLNEIYWCMMYNKDRQNAGQDALKIMNKIVKEEHKYDKEIDSRKTPEGRVDYFLGHTSIAEDMRHVFSDKQESHYYSSKAVRIGLRSQDAHKENLGDHGSWMNSEKLERILSKPLSDYATFKASVGQISGRINPHDLKEIEKIGVRTKAIELVCELLEDENLMTASDVVMGFSGTGNDDFEVLIQIFKKGQIGGVREIIILWIKARIMMNILEEVARLMCKSDKREILTKGRDKRLMMRGDFEEVTSGFKQGTPLQVIKESFDMTVWCQKFIPTIFTHTFNHHFRDHPGMQALATHVFLAHSNKKIEYPRKLLEQWMKHPEVKHDDVAMQQAKEKFLRDGIPFFINHSNMCQGIPHYTSSCEGLSSISLRDTLFLECMKQLDMEVSIKWKTRLGSDDKGTIIALDLSNKTSKFQAKLLGQCELVAERLHCMELSVKSASGHVMYELNSAYMANLETLSPTIKFTLAATDVFETSSCAGFVQQSFSSIRQMRENGSSSLNCIFAHCLNKRHFETIFDVGMAGSNNPQSIFGQRPDSIPYDFGVYPLYDCDLHELIGPEFYNYRIMKAAQDKRNPAVELLYTELSKKEEDEMFPRDEDMLLKKDHFGIHQGLVRQLERMRHRTGTEPKVVEKFFEDNPFVIVRGPQTNLETKMLVKSKLLTKGAAQSLRRTSPAIYIGRLTAFRSAKAWNHAYTERTGFDVTTGEDVYSEMKVDVTYREFLQLGIMKVGASEPLKIKNLLPILFPNHQSLNIVEQMCGKFGPLSSSEKKYSQAVRTLKVNNFNYEYSTGLKSILTTAMGMTQEASKEDVEEFKKLIGFEFDSLTSFKEDCKSRGIRPLDMFFYMTKLHKLSQSSSVQAFIHGPSSGSLHKTILTLKRFTHYPGATASVSSGYEESDVLNDNSVSQKIDLVKFYHNLVIMKVTGGLSDAFSDLSDFKIDGVPIREVVETIIRSTQSISGLDFTTQKSYKIAASECLTATEFKDKLVSWKDTSFTYIKRQKKNVSLNGKISWSGDLCVLVSSANECYKICETDGKRFLVARQVVDPSDLYRSLVSMCKTLGMELRSFFRVGKMRRGDIYLSDGGKGLFTSEVAVDHQSILNLRIQGNFQYKRIVDMVGHRVVKTYNSKQHNYQIHLEDHTSRTTTVCHSLCNMYPVGVPESLTVDTQVKFLGVGLSRLLENKDWFFNRRFKQMREDEAIDFLRNSVDMETVLNLRDSDMAKIQNYIEVREEVNEESFNVAFESGMILTDNSINVDDSVALGEAFRNAMSEKAMGNFGTQIGTGWADDVETEIEEMEEIMNNLEDTETVLMIRSIGYKKKVRKQMHTISTLQQGSEIRKRVLDLFFRNGSVRNERSKDLPGMIAWALHSDECKKMESNLKNGLIDHMCNSLSLYTGSSANQVRSKILDSAISLTKVPISCAQWYLSGGSDQFVSGESILDSLVEDSYLEHYESEDSDSF